MTEQVASSMLPSLIKTEPDPYLTTSPDHDHLTSSPDHDHLTLTTSPDEALTTLLKSLGDLNSEDKSTLLQSLLQSAMEQDTGENSPPPASSTIPPPPLPAPSSPRPMMSLPQLVPVTSSDHFTSMVTAPTSTSILNSGSPTFSAAGYQLPGLFTSPPITSSQQLQSPVIDRSSTNSDELEIQARKLSEQLAQVRSRLFLSSIDTANTSNPEYLQQLMKLEQLIHVLQEAVAARQAEASCAPSVILGGKRSYSPPSHVTYSPPSHVIKYHPYEGAGQKKRSSPKAGGGKGGKKTKHSGGSHGIQLWQFILELLGDTEHRSVLSWTGNGLEFRIINSVELARLWGLRKRNPIMNFDKLSRALRYYYEKNIIKHNPMHRLVYSFCNNPNDMVYNALLNRALATCPIDGDLAKQQVGMSPYQWQANLGGKPAEGGIKVTLQSVRNKMMGIVEDEKKPISVDNS